MSAIADPMDVFWSRRVDNALVGKSVDDQLSVLGNMIMDAEADKRAGYGPPQSDIVAARRRWLDIHEQWAADRLPSTRKEKAS